MSINNLKFELKAAVDRRIAHESFAMQGVMQNGRFVTGSKSYAISQAVECGVDNGRRVWAQRSKNGKVVVIGA